MAHAIIVRLSSNTRYWQADWQDWTGRRHKRSLGRKSKMSRRQARKRCQELANELSKNPGRVTGRAPKLGPFLEQYLESRTELKKSTRYLYALTSRYLKQFFGEELRIDQISRTGARDWR